MELLISSGPFGSAWEKVNTPYRAEAVGSMDWSIEAVVWKPLMDIDGLIVHTASGRVLEAGNFYEDFSFYCPVRLRWSVLRHFSLRFFSNPPYSWLLSVQSIVQLMVGQRYVYRSEVYFAGNGFIGRSGAASTDDFYAITLSQLPTAARPAVASMYRALSDAFPGQIRVHPGKRQSVPLNDGILQAVYALLDDYDPAGMFR